MQLGPCMRRSVNLGNSLRDDFANPASQLGRALVEESDLALHQQLGESPPTITKFTIFFCRAVLEKEIKPSQLVRLDRFRMEAANKFTVIKLVVETYEHSIEVVPLNLLFMRGFLQRYDL